MKGVLKNENLALRTTCFIGGMQLRCIINFCKVSLFCWFYQRSGDRKSILNGDTINLARSSLFEKEKTDTAENRQIAFIGNSTWINEPILLPITAIIKRFACDYLFIPICLDWQ